MEKEAGLSGSYATIEQVLGPLRSRLFELSQLVTVDLKKFKPYEHVDHCITTIRQNVFNFPASIVIPQIAVLQELLDTMLQQPSPDNTDEVESLNIGMAGGLHFIYKDNGQLGIGGPEEQEWAFTDSIIQELSVYKYNLEQIKLKCQFHDSQEADIESTLAKDKILTNLSADKLAAFFRILNEFDPDQDKIFKEYQHKADFFRAIIASFSSVKQPDITYDSFRNRYFKTEDAMIEVADFWISKFKSLHAAASNYKIFLESAPDKIGKIK